MKNIIILSFFALSLIGCAGGNKDSKSEASSYSNPQYTPSTVSGLSDIVGIYKFEDSNQIVQIYPNGDIEGATVAWDKDIPESSKVVNLWTIGLVAFPDSYVNCFNTLSIPWKYGSYRMLIIPIDFKEKIKKYGHGEIILRGQPWGETKYLVPYSSNG